MHRLPQYWEQPNEFLPDRFVGVSPESYANKYLPFSKGKRDCLGKYFATVEAKLAIAALVQRYDLRCFDEDEKIGYRITLKDSNPERWWTVDWIGKEEKTSDQLYLGKPFGSLREKESQIRMTLGSIITGLSPPPPISPIGYD